MRFLIAAAPLLLVTAAPAEAHIVSSRFGDFYAGALHPLSGLPDLVLWLALALVAGLQKPGPARWLLLVFPLALATGLATGLWAGADTAHPLIDGAGMVLLGALAALALRLPAPLLLAAGALLGLLRGFANASGLEPGGNPALFAAGLATAGYAFLALTLAAAATIRGGPGLWRTVALRAGGSWIVAIGVMAGTFALAR